MALVKNTRLLLIRVREDDMNKDKNDVIDVKFTWNGRDYGALVVVIF